MEHHECGGCQQRHCEEEFEQLKRKLDTILDLLNGSGEMLGFGLSTKVRIMWWALCSAAGGTGIVLSVALTMWVQGLFKE